MPDVLVYRFVIGIAVVGGIGGVLFGVAFEQLGRFSSSPPTY